MYVLVITKDRKFIGEFIGRRGELDPHYLFVDDNGHYRAIFDDEQFETHGVDGPIELPPSSWE